MNSLVANRYRLIRRLGGGGMGTVYLAEQAGVGNKVALKFLAPQLSNDEAVVKRFLQEGRVSLEVTHPGAAQLLDMGRDESGQLFLAFEYVEGKDLRELLETEGRLPFEEARDIALKVAEVMAHAHARGVVHRDVKPENIRVRRDLTGLHVKVLDFGIAKLAQAAGGQGRLTIEGSIAGTPRYMSPEQVRDEAIDARADLYSLGLVFFEMLTGRPAVDGTNVPQVLLRQMQDPLPSLKSVNPALDEPRIDALLARACAKAREERFPDMTSFIAALRALPSPAWPEVTGKPEAGPRVLVTPMALPVGRATEAGQRPSAVPVVLGLVLLLGAGLGFVALRDRRLPTAMVASGDCPELDSFDEAYRSLGVKELEDRVMRVRTTMPSTAADQLATLRAFSTRYNGPKRECMYKVALLNVVANEKMMLVQPTFWGWDKEWKDLELLFLELPLKQPWNLAQRKDVLAQVEELFIANLLKKTPADGDYWRRMYYAITVRCEVTDAALEQLKATRPDTCLNLKPR